MNYKYCFNESFSNHSPRLVEFQLGQKCLIVSDDDILHANKFHLLLHELTADEPQEKISLIRVGSNLK